MAVGTAMWRCPLSSLCVPSAALCPGGPGPPRGTAGRQASPDARRSQAASGLGGPGSAVSHLLFLCPQPETEDEKKRFEEGKGRYLQMKAKRQGQVEPQA